MVMKVRVFIGKEITENFILSNFSAAFYQMIAGIENHSEIIIRDAETKEQIKIFDYPEAFGN